VEGVSLNPEGLLAHATAWTLVLFRVAGVFVAAPVLTSVMVPARYKALAAAMLACCAYPMIPGVGPVVIEDLPRALVSVLGEFFVGLAIGAIAGLPLLMMELAGTLAGTTMGLGLARVFNPESDIDTDIVGQLLFFVAAGVYVALGGLEAVFAGLVGTFERVPPGAVAGVGPAGAGSVLAVFVGVLTSGTEVALRVAAPIVGIVFLLLIVMGVLGKTIPQLNAMTVGFSLQLLAGLAMLAFGLSAMREPIEQGVAAGLEAALSWASALGGAG